MFHSSVLPRVLSDNLFHFSLKLKQPIFSGACKKVRADRHELSQTLMNTNYLAQGEKKKKSKLEISGHPI